MKKNIPMKLTKDITSTKLVKGVPAKVYGKRGDKVNVVSERGNVLIVEISERFSVHKDFVN